MHKLVEVVKLTKLMMLEWKKLKRSLVIGEMAIYLGILMILPPFFIHSIIPYFSESYALAIELNSFIQLGVILFGASLINHVFIEEYKSKTMALSFGYPITRRKLFIAKILFIAFVVFIITLLSSLLSSIVIVTVDQFIPIINGQPTFNDMITFITAMISTAFKATIITFIPLFLFGIWKRAVFPTIICSIVVMQLPNFSSFINVQQDTLVVVFCILGGLSILLSIVSAEKLGEIK